MQKWAEINDKDTMDVESLLVLQSALKQLTP